MNASGDLGKVRAVICEDEPLARRALRRYLGAVDWIEIVGEAGDGPESVRLIHKLEPDVVFLDVQMPGLTGLEVLDRLTVQPALVFTTAFDEFALPAFDQGAVDYLVKPFGPERLIRTLDRVRVRLRGEARGAAPPAHPPAYGYPERIFARHGGGMVPVAVSEIRRVDAVDGGVEIQLADRTLRLDLTLAEMESRLDPTDFVRVHRAHVVNLAYVKGIERYDERRLVLRLSDGSTVVASRKGSQALREHMG